MSPHPVWCMVTTGGMFSRAYPRFGGGGEDGVVPTQPPKSHIGKPTWSTTSYTQQMGAVPVMSLLTRGEHAPPLLVWHSAKYVLWARRKWSLAHAL